MESQDPALSDIVKFTYPFSIIDTLAKKYVHGVSPQYPIYVDKARPVYQKEREIKGIKVLDSRGLWRCDNPFMGGFFYTLTFENPKNGDLDVIFGFVYAAGSEKRPLFRKMDAMYETLTTKKIEEEK